jgi:hypothetical protein
MIWRDGQGHHHESKHKAASCGKVTIISPSPERLAVLREAYARALARIASDNSMRFPVSNQASPVTESQLTGPQQAVAFIKGVFGNTESPVHVCALANDRNDDKFPFRKIDMRDPDEIEHFVGKRDEPGRAVYFCVGTLKPGATARNKENIAEISFLFADISFLFADIDLRDTDDKRADVERKLANLKYPPTCTVFSGHGIHAYWSLTESVVNPTADGGDQVRIEDCLRQLADVVGGDLQRGQAGDRVVELIRPAQWRRCPNVQTKRPPEGGLSVAPPRRISGDAECRSVLLPPIRHKAKPAEAEDHHCPR